MESIKNILMTRDDMSSEEVQELIDQCKADLHERLENGEIPDDICMEYFGLEPDYLPELIELI